MLEEAERSAPAKGQEWNSLGDDEEVPGIADELELELVVERETEKTKRYQTATSFLRTMPYG